MIKEDYKLDPDYNVLCTDIRCDILASIGHLGVGHIGGCLSLVELLTVLYFKEMRIDPSDPQMPGRDRLICSKGHAGPAVYATLAKRGYFDHDMLLTLNQGGTSLPSHCDMNLTPGIDMTTGSLGQGFSCAAGIALGSKMVHDHAFIYTIIGDGETQEGQIWEAAMFAASKKLGNLIAFTDYNKLQIDDEVSTINDVAPLADKWRAFGWNVLEAENGNDANLIEKRIDELKGLSENGKPGMLILHTKKGCGVKWIEDLGAGNHNTPLNEEQANQAIKEIRGI